MLLRTFLALLGLLTLTVAWAGEPPRATEVKLPRAEMTVTEALAELQKQTGNVTADRRTNKDDKRLIFKQTTGTYWQMLDAIGEQGISFSAYQGDGGVALVDTPYRKLTTRYSGIFRFAVKRITVTKDFETEAHHCQVTLDTAWEPRFKALYVNLESAEIDFGKGPVKLDRQTAIPVSGKTATDEIELRMNAPDRTVANIKSLKGTLRVIGVPKLLEFALAKLKKGAGGPADQQDGVKVQVTEVDWTISNKKLTRWTVEILTEYPEGAIVQLESFQNFAWKGHNRVWLSWGMDPKTKKPYELEPSGQSPLNADETKMRYEFTAKGDTPVPSMNANVTLRYRTPNRVVAFTVPFAFEALPLP